MKLMKTERSFNSLYFLVHAKHKMSMTPEQISRIENNARSGEYDRRSRKKPQRSPQSRKKPQRSRKKTNFFIDQSARDSAREVADRKREKSLRREERAEARKKEREEELKGKETKRKRRTITHPLDESSDDEPSRERARHISQHVTRPKKMGNVQVKAIEEDEVKKARFFIDESESESESEECTSKDEREPGRLQQLNRRANDFSLLNVELSSGRESLVARRSIERGKRRARARGQLLDEKRTRAEGARTGMDRTVVDLTNDVNDSHNVTNSNNVHITINNHGTMNNYGSMEHGSTAQPQFPVDNPCATLIGMHRGMLSGASAQPSGLALPNAGYLPAAGVQRGAMPRLLPEATGQPSGLSLPHDGYLPAAHMPVASDAAMHPLLRSHDPRFTQTATMPPPLRSILFDRFSRECIGVRNQHWLHRFREVAEMRSRGESLRGGYYSDNILAQWVSRQLEGVNNLEPIKQELLRSIGLL